MKFTVDTNVLVYAFEGDEPEKCRTAEAILLAGLEADIVLTMQAVAEFLNVVRRKRPAAMPQAVGVARHWCTLFPTVPTDAAVVLAAADFSAAHKLQLWDAIIWQAARRANAAMLLTEDLQDGLSIGGMTVVNPFAAGNAEIVAGLLLPA